MILEIIFFVITTAFSLTCIGASTYIYAGKSKTFVDAVKQFMTDTKNIFVGAVKPPQQPPVTYEHDFSYFTALTADLNPFFRRLNFDKAYSNQEQLQVSYIFSDCLTDILIIEAVYERFIRKTFNINQAEKVFVFAQIQGMHLLLTCAISDKCKQWVQQQEANRKSRQIPQNEDLVE